jgi:DNA-binding NarL/FixJ family response regulator
VLWRLDAIHAGAGGYIFLKDMPPEVLLQSIHRVVEGGTQMKNDIAAYCRGEPDSK